MKKTLDIKKLILLNMPYILLGLFATNFGEAWRMAQGADASEKFLSLVGGSACKTTDDYVKIAKTLDQCACKNFQGCELSAQSLSHYCRLPNRLDVCRDVAMESLGTGAQRGKVLFYPFTFLPFYL